MIFKLEHHPVNWIDGMKISKKHLIESNDYVSDLIRDSNSTQLTSFNYGLLPAPKNVQNSIELKFEIKNDYILFIKLNRCYAITQGGFKIYFDSHSTNELSIIRQLDNSELTNIQEDFDIILIANPFIRIPVGIPSLDENPPRHPYSEVSYNLQIIPSNQINKIELGPYYFIVGKIKNEYGTFKLDKNFIPPCSQLCAHEDMAYFHKNCLLKLRNIQNLSFSIIKKINEKNKPNTVAAIIHSFCKQIASFISNILFLTEQQLPEKPPIKLINIISSMAQNQYCIERFLSEAEREEYLKYVMEWTELNPKDVAQLFSVMCEAQYDHNNISESVLRCSEYLNKIEAIWNAFNSLEFIGQHKENMVVTKEVIQSKEEQPKKKWSILD